VNISTTFFGKLSIPYNSNSTVNFCRTYSKYWKSCKKSCRNIHWCEL